MDALEKTILSIQETVFRAKQTGMPISEYSLRRAIKSGSLPCRVVGRSYYIAWPNFVKWITCADSEPNTSEIQSENTLVQN